MIFNNVVKKEDEKNHNQVIENNYSFVYVWFGRVFTNGTGDRGPIPG